MSFLSQLGQASLQTCLRQLFSIMFSPGNSVGENRREWIVKEIRKRINIDIRLSQNRTKYLSKTCYQRLFRELLLMKKAVPGKKLPKLVLEKI